MNCTENPHTSFVFYPPTPGPFTLHAATSPPWLCFPSPLVHPFMEVPTSPKHSKDRQQVEREEDARGSGSYVIETPGSCLSSTVLVILFPGRGIWGAEKAHGVWHFESGVGRPWDRCLPLPLKIAILNHLKGSTGMSFSWGLNVHPNLC